MPAPKGNSFAKGKSTGRIPEYDPNFHPNEVYELCLLGSTDKEISEDFGISKSTLNRWKKEHEEFWDSLTRGKRRADAKVARGMFERATGYEHPETKFFVVKDGKDSEKVVKEETIARYPPDTKAAAIWLSNRTRNWRERAGDNPKAPDTPNNAGQSRSTPFTVIDPITNQIKTLEIGAAHE